MADKLSVRVGMGAGGGPVVVIDLGGVKTDRMLLTAGEAVDLSQGLFKASQEAYGSTGWAFDESPLSMIAKERYRQVIEEGHSAEHDDQYGLDELPLAGVCYAMPEHLRETAFDDSEPILWPWDAAYWKPTPDDRIRELVKAGALIAAEIDRLIRARAKEGKGNAD